MVDMTGWRGPLYLPWEGSAAASNVGQIVGSVIGGVLLFLIAALVRQTVTKEP